MKYDILISKRAQIKIDAIFEYLEQESSEKVKEDFNIQLLKKVDFLRNNPYMYPSSQIKKELRRCFITKHNVMYYKIIKNEVEIITIQDTRKEPKNIKL